VNHHHDYSVHATKSYNVNLVIEPIAFKKNRHLFDYSDFLRAFIIARKHLTLSSKLKSLVSLVKNWRLMMDVEELYFTENLNQNMDVLYMPSFLTVTKIYDYILNI